MVRAEASFAAGTYRVLPLCFELVCRAETCALSQTCAAGSCVSASDARTAPANAVGSPGAQRRPTPISGSPPALVVTTGTPADVAVLEEIRDLLAARGGSTAV